MKCSQAVDLFVDNMKLEARMNSPATERTYRSMLERHIEDIGNRDPRTVGRTDVKKTLARWANPNSQRIARSVLVSFYDFLMEEGHRKDNPARQTRRPKKRPTDVYRLTLSEVQAILAACNNDRERRVMYLGICAGLRNAELCGLMGKHFQRDNLIWVSKDIAKGGRERYVPVVPDLLPVWNEIRENVAVDAWVLPSVYWTNPGTNTIAADGRRAISAHGLRHIVKTVAKRAGIEAHIYPHLLRHAFGDHIARYAGIRNAQFLLGHASVGTTEIYTGKPTIDDLSAAVREMSFGLPPKDRGRETVRLIERPLIGATDESTSAKAFGDVLVRLRADLAPVAKLLGEGLS